MTDKSHSYECKIPGRAPEVIGASSAKEARAILRMKFNDYASNERPLPAGTEVTRLKSYVCARFSPTQRNHTYVTVKAANRPAALRKARDEYDSDPDRRERMGPLYVSPLAHWHVVA